MSEADLRCFVAVPVGHTVRERLSQWQRRIRKRLPNARWMNPENYHLTVKFYGELPEVTIQRLAVALEAALSEFPAFDVELVGIGAFPDLQHPRVLWAGVGHGADQLRELAGIVEAASVGLELPAERRDYHPHLTLARFRVPARARDLDPEVFTARDECWGRFRVEAAHMIHSRLTPHGPIYRHLYTFRLADTSGARDVPQRSRTASGPLPG